MLAHRAVGDVQARMEKSLKIEFSPHFPPPVATKVTQPFSHKMLEFP